MKVQSPHRVCCLVGICLLLLPSMLSAEPTFLNRQAFPLSLSLNETGRFPKNYLKTFEIVTQWNNPTNRNIAVEIAFTFYDLDSGKDQEGEDNKDDSLMTIVETFTIPNQVGHWAKIFLLTAIGEKLNQGFDHPKEGTALELYLDVQITRVRHLETP